MHLVKLLKEIDQLGSKCSKPQDFRAELESVNQTAKETVFAGHNAISPHELGLLEKIVSDIKLEDLDSESSLARAQSCSKFKLLMGNDMLRILAKTFFEQRPELIAWYYNKLLLTADTDEKLLDELVLLFDLAPDALILAVRDDSYTEDIILRVKTIFADQFEIFVRKMCAPEFADMRLLLAMTEVYSLSFVQQSDVPSLQFLINALIAPRDEITPEFRLALLDMLLVKGLAQRYISIASREKDKKTVVAMINFMLESLKIILSDEDGFEIVAGEHDVQSSAKLAELFAQLLDEQALKKTFAGSEMPLFYMLRQDGNLREAYDFVEQYCSDSYLFAEYIELCDKARKLDAEYIELCDKARKLDAENMQASLDAKERTVELFKCRVKDLGTNVIDLKRQVASLKRFVSAFKRKNETLKRENETLKRENETLKQRSAELHSEVDNLTAAIDSSKKDLTHVRLDNRSKDKSIGRLDKLVKSLTQKLEVSPTKKDEIAEPQASVAPVVPGADGAQSPTQLQSSTAAAVAPRSRLRVTASVFQPSSSASYTDAHPGFVVSSSESGSELDESAASAVGERTGSKVYSSASGSEEDEVYASGQSASASGGQPDSMFDSNSSEYKQNFPSLR